MFIVFNKNKILSYLISISTVTILLVLSVAITKNNEEILKTSTNSVISNQIQEETSVNIINSNQIQEENETNNNITKTKNTSNET